MFKKTIFTALALALIASPVLATDKKPQTPSQKAYNSAVLKAQNSMNAKLRSDANAAAGAAAQGGAGGSVGGDDVNTWGFSYTRNPVYVPSAVATENVVVTSMGVEVGPLGSYSNQSVELTPSGLSSMADVLNKASTYDGTEAGKAKALDYAAVVCTYQPELARTRYGDKCNDLAGIFPVGK